jgi:succinate dehydrogenase flavin-adding protein (antitoxin of CptAB toxin-antitoxin module)
LSEFIELCLPNKAPQHSGRGVRFELLSPTDRDAALISAAMIAGDDKIKLAVLRQREGVKRMLRAITKKKGLTEADLLDPKTEWMPVSHALLESDYDKLFTCRDDEVLAWFYREYHEPSAKDVEAIAKKARTASSG